MPNTVVSFDLSELSGVDPETTNLKNARIDFSPYSAYEITDGEWLTRAILRVRLPDGTGTATLPPTPEGNAYEVQERGWRGARHGYVLVPDVPEVDYTDLVWVDKDSLDPIVPPTPYWLQYMDAAIQTAVDALVAGAPDAMDTLKELADALGDDPNFATTIIASLAAKVDQTTYAAAIATINTALAGKADDAATSAALATKLNSSTYTAGMATKQDAATLAADVASHVTDGSALDTALAAKVVVLSGPVRSTVDHSVIPGYTFKVLADPGDPTEIDDIIIEAV